MRGQLASPGTEHSTIADSRRSRVSVKTNNGVAPGRRLQEVCKSSPPVTFHIGKVSSAAQTAFKAKGASLGDSLAYATPPLILKTGLASAVRLALKSAISYLARWGREIGRR